ncbi:MAG: histone deacetylase family protein [Candidatus Heimdallarchaeaceae archaeon]
MLDLVAIYSEQMKKHVMDPSHPETPERLNQVLKGYKIFASLENYNCLLRKAKKIETQYLSNVHSYNLINTIKSISLQGGGVLTWDNILNRYTYEAALYATGVAKKAAEIVHNNECKKSFAIVRPPGHHTNSTAVAGFCFFNNMAVAVDWLITEQRYKKIAIIDIDHHYGNGTADIFYNRKDVLYYSIHAHPTYSYPGTGYPFEIGEREGRGYTVNIPVLPRIDSKNWLYLFNKTINTVVEQYKPEIILVSVGFDALRTDPLGMLNLTTEAFQGAGYLIHELADKLCDGKVVSILEGGYDLHKLKDCTIKYLRGLLGEEPDIVKNINHWKIRNENTAMLKQVRRYLLDFWKI